MNKKTILVSGASGIVGYGILRSLKDCDCKLIGTTIYETSPADCFSDIVLHPPLTKDENYIPWLIDTIEKNKIDMIIPAIEDDMYCWNKNGKLLEKTGTIVLLNNFELINLCYDKWNFYDFLKKRNVNCLIETSLEPDFNKFKTPFIIKPRTGFGSKGVVKIFDNETFEKYKNDIGKTLMVQEFIENDDEEYTFGAFFDKNSNMNASILLKRKLSKQGFTEIAEVVFDDNIKKEAQNLAKILKPVGPVNFQFRKNKTGFKLLEINPRISSSTSIRKAFGYNESKMCVDYFLLNKEIKQPEIKKGKAIRYTEDFILQ